MRPPTDLGFFDNLCHASGAGYSRAYHPHISGGLPRIVRQIC